MSPSKDSFAKFRRSAWQEKPFTFLCMAYRYLLDRNIDPSGENTYMTLLTKGWSYSHIICAIIESNEYKLTSKELPFYLRRFVQNYRNAQKKGLMAWYLREFRHIEADLEQHRLNRAACRIIVKQEERHNESICMSDFIDWMELFDYLTLHPRNIYYRTIAKILDHSRNLTK